MAEKENEKKESEKSYQEQRFKLFVSSSPHIRDKDTTQNIMLTVILAVIPIAIYDIYLFGWFAARAFFWAISGALLTEALIQRLKKSPLTITDGSAILTGMLLAMCLPPRVPFWISFVGGVVAIGLGKQVYGGLGHNIFNPALVGRTFLLLSWAGHITKDYYEKFSVDTVTGASPLFIAKQYYLGEIKVDLTQFYQVHLFKNTYGSMGEVSVILILLGLVILLFRRIIDWTIPVSYVGTVFLLTIAAGRDPVFYTITGGLLFGAVFMATDYVTSPLTRRGKLIFGFGCGLFTFLMRIYSNSQEAVAYSILLMNALTPVIDNYTLPRKFGAVKQT